MRLAVASEEEEIAPLAAALAVLDDFAYACRLTDEWAGIARLERGLGEADREMVAPLLVMRNAAVREIAGEIRAQIRVPLEEVLEHAARADRLVLARREAARRERGRKYEQRADREVRRRAETRRKTVAVVRGLAPRPASGYADVPRVGVHTAVGFRELHPYAYAYVEMDASPPREPATSYSEGEQRTDTLSVVDRPEALLTLTDLWSDAWTRGMLRQAYQLLGPITRAVEVVEGVLQDAFQSGTASRPLQRRVLVAAGLLGSIMVVEHASVLVRGADDDAQGIYDLRAALLAVALASPRDATGWVEELPLIELPYALHETLSRAAARTRRGRLLSITGSLIR